MSDFEPDAFVVIHHPSDGGDPYGVGPFPAIPGLSDMLLTKGRCDCRLVILPVGFPDGITMAIGIDLDQVVGMALDQQAKDQMN